MGQSQVIMPAKAGIPRVSRRPTDPLSQMNGGSKLQVYETTSLFLKLLRPALKECNSRFSFLCSKDAYARSFSAGLAIFFEIATGLKPLAMTTVWVV